MSATAATPWRYGNLVAAIATIASCDIALGFTFQLLPILMEMQHIPAWIIGLNTAMGPIGILLAGPFLPRIISRVGAKRVAYICGGVHHGSALSLQGVAQSLYLVSPPLCPGHCNGRAVHHQRSLDTDLCRRGKPRPHHGRLHQRHGNLVFAGPVYAAVYGNGRLAALAYRNILPRPQHSSPDAGEREQ